MPHVPAGFPPRTSSDVKSFMSIEGGYWVQDEPILGGCSMVDGWCLPTYTYMTNSLSWICLLKIVVYYSILLGYAYLILSYSFWIYLDGWLVPGLFVRPQIEDHIPPDVFSPPAFSGPIDDNATSCSRALAASKYDEEQ